MSDKSLDQGMEANRGKPLTLMILCGSSPRHLYVANCLSSAAQTVAIVLEVGSNPTFKKLIKLMFKPHRLLNKFWRSFQDRKKNLISKEADFFFGTKKPFLKHQELVTYTPTINHPNVLELSRRHQPDVIAVFGTSLIREPLLNQAKLGMINLHGGLSPHYRGADCTFWALSNGKPEQVGCTLHFIDSGIDTGRLIAHICPEVRQDDNESVLFWRGVWESGRVYAQLLTRMANGESFGQRQTEKGALYQVKDRTWFAQRRLDRKMDQGLLKNVSFPKRVTWYPARTVIKK